jgi:hypothetical protein
MADEHEPTELPAGFVGVIGPEGQVVDDSNYHRWAAIEDFWRKSRRWFRMQEERHG